MARVPITVMGYRCERCNYEWIPRGNGDEEPRTCPKCRSPYWNRPRRSMTAYEDFRDKIATALRQARHALTWTEIRTSVGLPQLFPNNQWVHRLETDIGLRRTRDAAGMIHWQITSDASVVHDATAQIADPPRPRSGRKQSSLE
jgi:hypothetical protein